jgi:peptidoglycan/LPS O-acetylase OafA/YrhL
MLVQHQHAASAAIFAGRLFGDPLRAARRRWARRDLASPAKSFAVKLINPMKPARRGLDDMGLSKGEGAASEHYLVLDGLRGVAALCVVVMHVTLWFAPHKLLSGAGLAVDFFFCLSGFVVAHAYVWKLEQGMSLPKFLWLRLRRLYPLLFAGYAIGAVYALATLFKGQPGGAATSIWDILSSFALSLFLIPHQNAHLGYPIFPLDGATWSLFFEIWINVLFALFIVMAGFRRSRWIFLLMIAAGIAVCTRYETALQGFTLASFHVGVARVCISFFIGVMLQNLPTSKAFKLPETGAWIFPLLAAALVVCFLVQSYRGSRGFEMVCILLIFPAIVILGTTAKSERLGRPLKMLGDLSYPLYILHGPLIFLIVGLGKQARVFGDVSDPALLTVAAFGAVVISWIVLKLYDEPIRAYLSRRVGAGQTRAVPGLAG